MHNARFLGGVSHSALMRPDDETGAGTAASEEAAAAAADAAGAASGEGDNGAAAEAGDTSAAADGTKAADKTKPAEAAAADTGKAAPNLKDVLPKWAADEIADGRRKAAKAKEEAERERAARRAAEELVEHLKRGNGGAAATGEAAVAPAVVETAAARASGQVATAEQYNADVLTAAERLRFNDACNDVFTVGTSEFKDFQDAISVLNAANVMQDDFLMDVLAADKAGAHRIIHDLSRDPEKAIKLVNLPSRQRIAELVRMTSAKPAPKRETNAPAPIRGAVQAVATADDGDLSSDNVSDDEWSARFDKKYMKSA